MVHLPILFGARLCHDHGTSTSKVVLTSVERPMGWPPASHVACRPRFKWLIFRASVFGPSLAVTGLSMKGLALFLTTGLLGAAAPAWGAQPVRAMSPLALARRVWKPIRRGPFAMRSWKRSVQRAIDENPDL